MGFVQVMQISSLRGLEERFGIIRNSGERVPKVTCLTFVTKERNFTLHL